MISTLKFFPLLFSESKAMLKRYYCFGKQVFASVVASGGKGEFHNGWLRGGLGWALVQGPTSRIRRIPV